MCHQSILYRECCFNLLAPNGRYFFHGTISCYFVFALMVFHEVLHVLGAAAAGRRLLAPPSHCIVFEGGAAELAQTVIRGLQH